MKPSVASLSLLLVLTVGLLGCGGSRTPEESIEFAKSFRDNGDLDAAIVELKSVLRDSPDNAEARQLIGAIYLQSGDGQSAEKEILRSIELGADATTLVIPLFSAQLMQSKFQEVIDYPVDSSSLAAADQVAVLVMRGDAQFGLGDLDKADASYDEALAQEAEEAAAGVGKARVASLRGDLDGAREWLDTVIGWQDDFAPAWSLKGDIEQYLGNMESAQAAYTTALEARPNDISDLANRALTHLALGNMGPAGGDIQAARVEEIARKTSYPVVSFARGRLSIAQREYARAGTALEQTLKTAPDYLPARFFLAVAQYHLGRIEQAEQNLVIFRNQAPQFPGGHRLYAAIKYSQGQYADARAELENLLSFDPDDAWALGLLADVAVAEGNPEQSIATYKKLVELHPDSERAQLNLALGMMLGGQGEAQQVLDAAVSGTGSAQARMLKILALMKASNWDEAITAGKSLTAEMPQNWDAYTLLGGAYLGKGDTANASNVFARALEVQPGNPNAANNLARLELQQGNIARARQLYEEVLKHHPDEIPPVQALAALDYQEGKPEAALQRLEAAVNKHPGSLELKLTLAGLNLRMGQPSRNLSLSYETGDKQENNPQVIEVLGDSQSALGQYEAAAASYEKLVALHPDSVSAHYRLAATYAAMDQLDRSQAELKRVVELQPDHFGANVMRVRLLRRQGRMQEAMEVFTEIDPAYAGRPEVLIEGGWLAMHQKKYPEAIKSFESAFGLVPSSVLVIQLGIARWNSGDVKGAIEGYTSWLKSNPGDTQVLFHLANGQLLAGSNKEAIAAFRQLLQQNPDDPVVLNNLAWLLRDSNPKEARSFAEKATRIAPEWGPGLDTLGSILLAEGDLKQAYRNFEQALQFSPDNPDIRYHLALASSRMGENEQAMSILRAILAQPEREFENRAEAQKLLKTLQEKNAG